MCVCWGWSIASEFCVSVCAGSRARAGVLLVNTLCVCVCVLGPGLELEYCY